MTFPEREITEMELRRSTGERGTRMYVALRGIVYDVTDCPKWRSGLHENLHFAGQDLTEEFPDAPHMLEVFQHPCVKVAGRLKVIGQ
jgi:predicted heme/steroid binding protein